MRVLIEGPRFVGRWTEIVAHTLTSLGHPVGIHYHNRKALGTRFLNILDRKKAKERQKRLSNRALTRRLYDDDWDILLSIQGHIRADDIRALRSRRPSLRVVLWWGDILTANGHKRIRELFQHVDLVMNSYAGDVRTLLAEGITNVYHFPFAVHPAFHCHVKPTSRDRRRFGSEVSFVGGGYPARCELIRYLNAHLHTPVRVWGRGWNHCRGVGSRGPLSLAESLKVYACSKLSLNLHHADTDDGFNMKFFEIPAAGGFQLCDWQPELGRIPAGQALASYHDREDALEKIRYYLAHDEERLAAARKVRTLMLEHNTYAQQFVALFEAMGLAGVASSQIPSG